VIRKIPAKGGDAVRITEGDSPEESPDGKFLYFVIGDHYPERCSVWRMPTGGGEKTKVVDSVACSVYAVGERGIFFFTPLDGQGRSDISVYDLPTGKTRKLLTIESMPSNITVSPDGRTILYTQFDRGSSDLMLVENFR
jgi:Tol biopolymer transport system component